jgi:hypothetical protein
MELVMLNIGLDLGVLSPPLYSMMGDGLVTTLMTAPLLAALDVRGASASASSAAQPR